MRTRLAALVAVGVVAVVTGAGAASGVLPWWPRPDGPLAQPDPHGYALPVEVGEVVTDAFDMLVVEGDAPVVIKDVTPVYADTGVRTVGTLLSGADRAVAVESQFYRQWPPADEALGAVTEVAGSRVHPPDETRIPPQVLIGMEVAEPGHHLRQGFWVTYAVGLVHYREYFDAQLTFCTPAAMDGDVCPFLGDG